MGKPIVLSDPHLDASHPFTRLFLACEYWHDRTDEARDLLRRLINAIDGNGGDIQRVRNEADNWLGARAIAGVQLTAHVVPDGVWEALQRLIENAETLGPASKEDALLVARWRGQFVPAREVASGVPAERGEPEAPKDIEGRTR